MNMTLKPSDDEDPVLELWGMRSTPSLPLLLLEVVIAIKVLSMGQIEQINLLPEIIVDIE